MTPKSNRILTRSLLGAVLVFFLLPFTTLTCGGTKLATMNGIQLATGSTIKTEDPMSERVKTQEIKAEPLASVALLLGVVALGLAFLGGKAGRIAPTILAGLCAATLLIMKMRVDQNAIAEGHGMISITWEMGFYLALLAAVAGAVVSSLPTKADPAPGA